MTLPLPVLPIPPQPTRSPAAPVHPAPGDAAGDLDLFGLGAFDVHDGDVRVPLRGELDLATGPALLAGLALLADPDHGASPGTSAGTPAWTAADSAPDGLRPSRRGTVQLEMSDLTFLDSSGLSALNDARATLIVARLAGLPDPAPAGGAQSPELRDQRRLVPGRCGLPRRRGLGAAHRHRADLHPVASPAGRCRSWP